MAAIAFGALCLVAPPGLVPARAGAPAAVHGDAAPGSVDLAAARASLAAGYGPAAIPSVGTGPNWTELYPGSAPNVSMTYDAADGYVLAFQGLRGAPGNATWTFANGSWTQLRTTVEPSPRDGAALTYDAAQREVVLFGGERRALRTLSSGGVRLGHLFLNDTWGFRAGSWSNLTGGLPSAPAPREGASFAFDTRDGYAVLFGGEGGCAFCSNRYLNDTWNFSATGWTRIPTSVAPPTREDGALVYSTPLAKLLLFGGLMVTISPGGYGTGPSRTTTLYNDSWSFLAGTWTALALGGPAGGRAPLLADSPGNGTYLVLGGTQVNSTGTWNLTATGWVKLVLRIGPGDAGAMVNDPRAPGILLFGATPWVFRAGAWTTLGPRAVPAPAPMPYLVYDAHAGYVLLLDGQSTWTYAAGAWHDITAAVKGAPTARSGAAISYDGANGTVLLFSGTSRTCAKGLCTYAYLGDSWQFNGTAWTQLNRTVHPSYRWGARMAYDAADGYVVLFGGASRDPFLNWVRGTPCDNDTWKFDHGNWTNISGAAPPPGRLLEGLAYDPIAGDVVLFGGGNGPDPVAGTLNDTWTFLAGSWTNRTGAVAPLTGPSPDPREAMGFAFDGAINATVLFGGSSDREATFVLRGGHWSYANFSGQLAPPPGLSAALVYDPAIAQDLAFGLEGRSLWSLRLA